MKKTDYIFLSLSKSKSLYIQQIEASKNISQLIVIIIEQENKY